jgi:predicted small lipoprotein YifL
MADRICTMWCFPSGSVATRRPTLRATLLLPALAALVLLAGCGQKGDLYLPPPPRAAAAPATPAPAAAPAAPATPAAPASPAAPR